MTHLINGIEVYADVITDPDTGKVLCVDFAVNAPSRAHIEAAAIAKNMMVARQDTQKNILSPASYDPETGDLITAEVSEIEVLREWVEDARGTNSFAVAVVLEPATYDAEGEVITPAVIDPAQNYNLRIGEPLISRKDENGWFLWELLLLEWMGLGVPGTVNGKVPGVIMSEVSLVDLSKTATPQLGIA